VPASLTIITPSLNQGAFIERTIRSVLDQDHGDLEYVIVDGGSTDETIDVIRRYEDHLAWWISEPDGGQADAINKALERTTGEVVAFINSDDYYLPGAFEAALGALEASDREWVAGAAVDMGGADGTEDYGIWRPVPPAAVEKRPRGRHWWVLAPWHVPQPPTFWCRSLFDQVGGFRTDMHYAFDAEFMLRAAMAGHEPVLLPDRVLAVRAIHPAQKGSDARRWLPELKRLAQLYESSLSPREQRWLRVLKGPVHALRLLRETVVNPVLRGAGRAVALLPERIRPKVRDRDRRDHLADGPGGKNPGRSL
jgi:glycosyltransferase involved in cell wall biosynthesis